MRLIDADALSEKLCETTIFIKGGEAFQRMINDATTIDTEPVKHGEWIDHGTTCQRYECSICGDQHDWLILPNNINFCPNCGAKMDGGKESEVEE